MKSKVLLAVLGLTAVLRADVVLAPNLTEVVVPRRAPATVRVAAQEMTNALAQVLGCPIPVVQKKTPGRAAVFLGDGEAAREAGIDVARLPRDGFALRTVGTDRIVIAGRDAPLARFIGTPNYTGSAFFEHATVFGVYAFLERFADCRFFFPGELGTILPRAEKLVIPPTDFADAPDSPVRRYYNHAADGRWFDETANTRDAKGLNWLRTRMSSLNIPCCHGSIRFQYVERFKETHPEYFSLDAKGNRRSSPTPGRPDSVYGQLCWSSAITNELFLDAKCYLTGGDPAARGLSGKWGVNCCDRKFVDIMPNDAYQECCCAACRAAKLPGANYANDIIWKATAGIAQRLIDEGIPGYITQMSYHPYKDVPAFHLPTNVLVMVAVNGPYSHYDAVSRKAQFDRAKAWMTKTGHKVWLWTYPGKWGPRAFADVPQICPRAWGAFYREMAAYSIGAFAESESDRWFYNHLNYYVFGKVMWRTRTDVEAVLTDYYARMYGAAAEDVRQMFESLEETWLKKTMGRTVDTPLGPQTRVPSVHDLWNVVYTPNYIASVRARLDAAVAKVAKNSLEARRLALLDQEIVSPLARASAAYLEGQSVSVEQKRRAAHPEEVSIVSNGDFTESPRGRFFGGWYVDKEPAPLSQTESVVGGQSVVLTGAEDGKRQMVGQYLPQLKPNTRYRISFYLKLADVVSPEAGGGASITLMDDWNHSFPERTAYTGTMDWTHCQFTYTTRPGTNGKKRAYIRLVLSAGCTGTAWFDGVRIVEMADSAQ